MSNDRQQRAARAEQMRKEREKTEKRQRSLITIVIVVAVIALIAVAAFGVNKFSSENSAESEVITPVGATQDYGVVVAPADLDADAEALAKDPVRVVLYEDLSCPVCASFEQAYAPEFERLTKDGEIEVEYRLINFLDDSSPNEYSSRAGSAALCAFTEGSPEQFQQVLTSFYQSSFQPVEGTSGPGNAALLEQVESAGVDDARSCVMSARYGPWLTKAKEAAFDDGISGTPSVLVDGKKVENPGGQGVPQFDTIKAAIDAAKS